MDYNNNPDCWFSKGQDSCFDRAANIRKRSMDPKSEAEDIHHRREGKMSKSTAAKNKAIVLEAVETMFNKRDYAAAEKVLVTELHSAQCPHCSGTRRTLRTH